MQTLHFLELTVFLPLQEQVSLDELAMQATEDERRATQIVLHDTERQIMILTRQPIIALRYKLRNGQVVLMIASQT